MRERDLPAQGTQKNVAPAMPQAENDRRGEPQGRRVNRSA